jgi:hypothetical protein
VVCPFLRQWTIWDGSDGGYEGQGGRGGSGGRYVTLVDGADTRILANDVRRRASEEYRREQGTISHLRTLGSRRNEEEVSQNISNADARIVDQKEEISRVMT